MGIKISSDSGWALFSVIMLVFILFLIYFVFPQVVNQGEANDVIWIPEGNSNPSPTININTTSTDPILGRWVRSNGKPVENDNITFESDGFINKIEKNNENLTYTTGSWEKESKNSYSIQWLIRVTTFQNFGNFRDSTPPNETISYDPSSNSINVSGVFYIRSNATLKGNSS